MEQRGGISIVYSSLASSSTKLPYMEAWEKDIQEDWDLGDWHRFFSRSYKRLFNSAFIEANLKLLTRW